MQTASSLSSLISRKRTRPGLPFLAAYEKIEVITYKKSDKKNLRAYIVLYYIMHVDIYIAFLTS